MNDGTALLVIDAQVNMFAPDNAVYASEMLLKTLGRLVARARSAHIPVVYVRNNGGPGDPEQPGTPGWQIHPALVPSEGDVIMQKWIPDQGVRHSSPLPIKTKIVGARFERKSSFSYPVLMGAIGNGQRPCRDIGLVSIYAEINYQNALDRLVFIWYNLTTKTILNG